MPSFRSSRAPVNTFFLEVEKDKVAAVGLGRDLIDVSVGIADLQPEPVVIERLREATHDSSTYSYCLKSGTRELREAACAWYQRRYGTQLDPNSECISLIGSQEGLAHLLLGVTEHGDSVLMLDVAYPSYWGALQVAGLHPVFLPLGPDLLPDLGAVKEEDARRAKCMLLNYPNNPTSVTATPDFFQKAIDFCIKHQILLIHDNPYIDQQYEGQAPSPLALPRAKECCVELFSFAKSHHIAGFRLGWALGNQDAIAALEAVKAPIDFNQYRGIQLMGVLCLSLPEDRVKADAQVWRSRAVAMVEALAKEGWVVRMPSAGMYLWAKLPGGVEDDRAFCRDLVMATGVALGPGRGFGPGGAGHVRFALVHPLPRLLEAARRIGEWCRSQGHLRQQHPGVASARVQQQPQQDGDGGR